MSKWNDNLAPNRIVPASGPLTPGERQWMRAYEKTLNARAEVEQVLFDVYHGKRPTLTPEECRELAVKLGVPQAHALIL